MSCVILLGFECTINPQNLIKFVGAIFEKIENFNYFFLWGGSKTKIWASKICERTLYIEFKRDWSVGSGPTLGDGENFKNIFPVSGIFSGKPDITMLLGFECTINPQNLIKIVEAIFEKLEILIVFLMWTTLNFRGRGKTKTTGRDIYMRTLYIEFERDWSIGLGSTFGRSHRQTDRHTHTHTHTHTQTFFLKHIFRLWEWCIMKNHQKIEVENFDDCNTSFTPNVARK